MTFDQQITDLLDKETRDKLATITRLRKGEYLGPGICHEDLDDFESMFDLMYWNLGPLEAMAKATHDEIAEGNLYTADILMNDVRLKIKRLGDTIEEWMGEELKSRLTSAEQKKAPDAEASHKDSSGA